MKQSGHSPDPSELESLTYYLQKNKDTVLTRWEDTMQERGGEQPSELALLSRRTFYENIPLFLQQVCERLSSGETDTSQPAGEHRARRWERSLDLRVIVSGWMQLYQILADQINQSPESVTISPGSLIEAHRRLPQSILRRTRQSVDEYYRFWRQEAEGELRELETVAQEQSSQKGQREVNLHQVSHDLKGSMTALRMNLELLESIDLSSEARRIVDKLAVAADNLTQLLENLLDLSRLEAGREEVEVSQFDAAELLDSLCKSLQPVAETEGLELHCSGEAPLHVWGDRMKIRRIAQNLLLNALKYTREGYVEVSWKTRPADRWLLSIRDTGPGLDSTKAVSFTDDATTLKDSSQEEPSAESGQPQSSADQKQHSEGIGLVIVRQLCELLGGEVEVESKVGVGTHFRIVFPADYSAG